MDQSTTTKPPAGVAEPDKDVIYALRTAQQSQIQLSIVADQKANIVIGICLILMSIMHSRLLVNAALPPTPLLLVSCAIGVAFVTAILVVMPRTKTLHLDAARDMPDPLFFGSFANISLDDYRDYMTTTLTNNETARRMLVTDIYFAGAVLGRKYLMLQISYAALLLAGILSFGAIVSQNLPI
jgi:hypothetical protein